jgi:hypothetical protein
MCSEKPYHGDSSPASGSTTIYQYQIAKKRIEDSLMRGSLVFILRKDDSNGEVACCHCNGAQGQEGFALEFVNIKDSREGSEEHHDANNTSSQE